MNIISVMPYFSLMDENCSGVIAQRTKSNNSENYKRLYTVVKNQLRYTKRVIVYVCSEIDLRAIQSLPVEKVLIKSEPRFLPANMMSFVKDLDFDFIYYTESDQILHSTLWDEFPEICADGQTFIIPSRFIRIGNQKLVKQNKKNFGMPYKDKYLIETSKFRAFGGAWFCSNLFFKKIIFSKSCDMPIEHASCFDLFSVMQAKSLITINPFDFYVDHLSGEDENVCLL